PHREPAPPVVAKEYGFLLQDNFAEGAEGLTHEGLFAAEFFRALGDHLTAAKYFFHKAEAMSQQAPTASDQGMRDATVLAYELAMESATTGGRPDVARGAQMPAYD